MMHESRDTILSTGGGLCERNKKKLRVGIVSYNIYCNFTNYGSALQSWALSHSIEKLGYTSVLIRYCPDILKDKHPLHPLHAMWDTDAESRRMLELSMPAIRTNYAKFDNFFQNQFQLSKNQYTRENFAEVVESEKISGFVCGSDTIFCTDEFGFDDGYYANYPCMRNGYTFSYAASFGDAHFEKQSYAQLNQLLQNFKAIGLREEQMVNYVTAHVRVPVQRVLDPTLLVDCSQYNALEAEKPSCRPYVLLYSRRYNPEMESFADKIAKQNDWDVVEISLRATNDQKGHIMRYGAGVEEFLSLVHHAQCVITNSFHGTIFSVQYQRPFFVFSREQCDTKIDELLHLLGLEDRKLIHDCTELPCIDGIDYDAVQSKLHVFRQSSLHFLQDNLASMGRFVKEGGHV